jgi:signal transduction histidine kinase
MPLRNTQMPPLVRSLSARLLVLTIFFVMVAEVLIYAPSIARFRESWLAEKIASAHLAGLALEATPDNMVSEDLEKELLRHVGAYGVILYKDNAKSLTLSSKMPPKIDAVVDLMQMGFVGLIGDAFAVLARGENRVLQVKGSSPRGGQMVAVVLDEKPLREAMRAFSQRILLLSIVISVFTAALVYISLHWLIVLPMRRITGVMIRFRDNPDLSARAVISGESGDEIGIAERELAAMHTRLRAALRQRQHLAALGEAVAKINHDLRNMLATARLVSERLATSADPDTRRALPILERAIDRAASLCTQTLKYFEESRDLNLTRFSLAGMLDEVGQLLDCGAKLEVAIARDVEIEADREELFRVFANLVRNALEAGAEKVVVRLGAADPIVIEVCDNGPGLPPRAVEHLFKPFAGSARAGGTGLGLAIARELMRAHGGDTELQRTGATGTVFALRLSGGASS